MHHEYKSQMKQTQFQNHQNGGNKYRIVRTSFIAFAFFFLVVIFDVEDFAANVNLMAKPFGEIRIPSKNEITQPCVTFSSLAPYLQENDVISQIGPAISVELQVLTDNLYSASNQLSKMYSSGEEFFETLESEMTALMNDLNRNILGRLFAPSPHERFNKMTNAAILFQDEIRKAIAEFQQVEAQRDAAEGSLIDGEDEASKFYEQKRDWFIFEWIFGQNQDVKKAIEVKSVLKGTSNIIESLAHGLNMIDVSLDKYRSYVLLIKGESGYNKRKLELTTEAFDNLKKATHVVKAAGDRMKSFQH
ncbi:hypothetical protein G9A89_021775 [Geosiphon pyriformis]|nr:hypothetical protein G9A89_021775 [Geosiphon pyriformis]